MGFFLNPFGEGSFAWDVAGVGEVDTDREPLKRRR
jgi:hypothetical protein